MPGPRDYSAATRAALNALAKGTCYFPGCSTSVVVLVEGDPFVNADIAHIRDARPGNRYDPSMSDAERAHFDNLILLCRPHHQLVDRVRPADYPPSVLIAWKAAREEATAATGRQSLLNDYVSASLAPLPLPIDPPVYALPDGVQLTPYQALWPRYAVVPFDDHAGVLQQLSTWCSQEADVSALIIDGSGGNGKTRAAIELCRSTQSAGWLAGFFRHGTLAPSEVLKAQHVDRLLVFDYANDKPNQIQAFLESYLDSDAPKVGKTRFLLLTRNDERTQSISRLTARQTRTTQLLDSAETIFLDTDATSFNLTARRRLFGASKSAFTALWEPADEDAGPLTLPAELESDTYNTPLFVVLAALLSTYAKQPVVDLTREDLLARILSRESQLFWHDCPINDREMREELVCVSTIAAIETEPATQSRLQAIGYGMDPLLARRVCNWLHKLYPGRSWANGLEPDLLGEYLLRQRIPAGLAAHVAVHGDINEASEMLRVMGRILAESPSEGIRRALVELVATFPDVVPTWLSDERDGDTIASDALEGATELINLLAEDMRLPHIEVPGRLGPAGRQLAVAMARKWHAEETGVGRWKAGIQLVGRLLNAERVEEAKVLIPQLRNLHDEGVGDSEILEHKLQLLSLDSRALRMSKRDPLAPLEEAISLLTHLPGDERDPLCGIEGSIRQQYADTLVGAGRFTDADGPLDEAVRKRRLAVAEFGNSHTPALAASLRARAMNRHRNGDPDAAMLDVAEAIELLRGFLAGSNSVFEKDLARSYDVAARILREHDGEAAIAFTRDSLAARARLAEVFGVDAKIDFLAGMIRAFSLEADQTLLTDAVDLLVELANAGSIGPEQLHVLQALHKRLLRSATSAEMVDRLVDLDTQIAGDRSNAGRLTLKGRLGQVDILARGGEIAAAADAYREIAELADTADPRLRRLAALLRTMGKFGHADELAGLDGMVAGECEVLIETYALLEMKPRHVLVSLAFLTGWLEEAGGHRTTVARGYETASEYAQELIRERVVRAHLAPKILSRNRQKGRLARRGVSGAARSGSAGAPSLTLSRQPVRRSQIANSRPLAKDARLLALRDELLRRDSERPD